MPLRTLIFFSLPMFAGGLINMLIGNAYLKYSTDVLLMSPAIMGLILLGGRIWDAFNDPLVGFFNDKYIQYGRKRWVSFAALPVVVCFTMLWLVPAQSVLFKTIYISAALMITLTALTAVYVPHYSMAADLSSNEETRNRIFGSRAFIENLGVFAAVAIVGLISEPAEAAKNSPWLFSALAIFLLLLFLLFHNTVKEAPPQKPDHTNFFQALKKTWHNRPAFLAISISLLSQLGATLVMTVALYFTDYVLNNKQAGPLVIGLFMISATASVPAWVKLAEKHGKLKLLKLSLYSLCVGFLLIAAVTAQLQLLLWGLSVILGLFAGCLVLFNPTLLADSIEENKQHEALFFSLFTFANKCAMGLAGVLVGFGLALVDFKPVHPQPGAVQLTIRILFSAGPALCFLLAAAMLTQYRRARFFQK